MTRSTSQAVLGHARYRAQWVRKSNLVRLTAVGILPCSNYIAALEKRADKVVPPNWDIVFYIEDHCEKAIRPFEAEAYFINDTNADKVNVTDAVGSHDVPIEAANVVKSETWLADPDKKPWVVYSRITSNGGAPWGCIVVPEDALVLAIYSRIFGPATRAECEQFVLDNCQVPDDRDLELRGGEVPWPLLT